MDKKEPPGSGNFRAAVQDRGDAVHERLQNHCTASGGKKQEKFFPEGRCPPVSGMTLFFVVVGICAMTHGVFAVVDLIEGK